jgi:hypothetical protein
MKEEGENHLLVPLVKCPCLDKGSILDAPPKTSMATNQYIHIQYHTQLVIIYVSSIHKFIYHTCKNQYNNAIMHSVLVQVCL